MIEFPTIEIFPVSPNHGLDRVIAAIPDYSWIIFTSVNSVDIFLHRIMAVQDARILGGIKIAVIGPETGRCLIKYGINADLTPERFTSEGILESLKSSNAELEGKKF